MTMKPKRRAQITLCLEDTAFGGSPSLLYNRLSINRTALALVWTVFMKIMKKKACLLIA